ncbi:BES1/BZR1 homolog protein 3-like [Cornus florida]|uniref:BES1/BZR1 homolog protein 3-like n=1 Tax=Cornus florida TaxID=4283 RepID=UPI00289F5CC8|nr:BES1/BZR1 homolog protein 3-like [Cornus florida]
MDSESSGNNTRSAADKERTKMRERRRRSITTNILHGLRKHGGYRLSPRADINQVLRELAKEAGWVVDPDGTTYRSTSTTTTNGSNVCPLCGTRKGSSSTSIRIGGGECSTTVSPRRVTDRDSVTGFGEPATSLYYSGGVAASTTQGGLAPYMYGMLDVGINQPSTVTGSSTDGGPSSAVTVAYQRQQLYLQEARASNQNTPMASPQRHT